MSEAKGVEKAMARLANIGEICERWKNGELTKEEIAAPPTRRARRIRMHSQQSINGEESPKFLRKNPYTGNI